MNVTRRRLVVVVMVALALVVAIVGIEQFARSRVSEESLQPQAVRLLGEGGDPLVVMVGATWKQDSYCSGQFHVKATETISEVRVGTVVSRLYGNGTCAGIGSDKKMAWAPLTLALPLGARKVVRDRDGEELPVLAPLRTS
jgi:hypothetical protein